MRHRTRLCRESSYSSCLRQSEGFLVFVNNDASRLISLDRLLVQYFNSKRVLNLRMLRDKLPQILISPPVITNQKNAKYRVTDEVLGLELIVNVPLLLFWFIKNLEKF